MLARMGATNDAFVQQLLHLTAAKQLEVGTIVVGGLLALILILIINRAYFGWTIAFHWPWGALAEQAATILVASVLASLYPALRASRTPATELSRENL